VDVPDKGDSEELDVVLLAGATEDGEGAKVLRARSGRIEAGEVRPLREGKPLASGGEVVRLLPRKDAPALYDVRVEHVVEGAAAPDRDAPHAQPAKPSARSKPAQVATRAYRDSWERTFGTPDKLLN
jgi:hypothetical protein